MTAATRSALAGVAGRLLLYIAPISAATIAGLAGCGTRSGLLVDEAADPFEPPGHEAEDARSDAGPRRPEASTPDSGEPDVAPDAHLPDAEPPPPDVGPPPPDAGNDVEVPPPGCDELADVLYLLSDEEVLYTFQPETLRTERIGAVSCDANLNSMAVARTGEAYVSSDDGRLFRVDPRTASCTALPFDTSQLRVARYGMGFVATDSPRGEGLFIVEEDLEFAYRLSEINLGSLAVRSIGEFAFGTPNMELTGTGDGRLFGYHVATPELPASLMAIDKETAAILAEVPIAMAPGFRAFHFAHWNGNIYIFMTLENESQATVYRFSLLDRSLVNVGVIDPVVVGAGVSTCAPL